jgi:hypothetical protein
MDTQMSGKVSKSKRRPPPKKRKREDNPIALDRARTVYKAVRFGGCTLAQAHKQAFPRSKATDASKRNYAKRIYDWFDMHYRTEILEMEKMFGLDIPRVGYETDQRLKAMTLKNVKVIIEPKNGQKFKPFVVEKTIEVEDNSTRMRATELLKDIVIGKQEKGPAIGVIILNPDPRVRKPEGSGE